MNALILSAVENDTREVADVVTFAKTNLLDELEVLFRSSYKKLVGFACLLILPREVAEDIVQEVFISTAIKAKNRSASIEDLNAYIKAAIALKAKEYHRKNFLRSAKDSKLEAESPYAPAANDKDNENKRITALINSLPHAQKHCVVLKFYEGLETAEIATYLNISESSVRTHLSRATHTIKTALERIGG
ncbi:MAG TPA: sigma-70 family RNA polymerase sigma factor [Acidimicrobiia bacterium]|nr:sigma-70 family RNA polymerase sigma factor [Acidimicrobiia bacterium]